MGRKGLTSSTGRAVVLAACVCVAMSVNAATQTAATLRVQGRLTDPSGAVLPGATVSVEIGGQRREAITDNTGQYAFESIDAHDGFTLTAALHGFRTQEYRATPTGDSGTLTINFLLLVNCNWEVIAAQTAEVPRQSLLERLLTADAVVHLRVLEDAVSRDALDDEGCQRLSVRPSVQVIASVHSRPGLPVLSKVLLMPSDTGRIKAGDEYLLFAYSGEKLIYPENRWPVIAGRLGKGLDELHIPKGTPIDQTLRRLRTMYERHTRYRTYYSDVPRASLTSLRYGTGWVELGRLARHQNVWNVAGENVGLYQRPFQIVGEQKPERVLPRPGDEIRLPDNQEVSILNFGVDGEAFRKMPPFPWRWDTAFLHGTGVDIISGEAYRVEDVRIWTHGSERSVWIRISAGTTDAAR